MKYIGDIKSVYMMSSEIGKVAYRLRHYDDDSATSVCVSSS